MSGKVSIPVVSTGADDVDRFAESVKVNLESIMGQNKNATKLTALPATASTGAIITQLNAILARIQ